MNPSLLVIAGEASGDGHAARLVSALKRQAPGMTFWGIGGDQLAAQGVELLHHIDAMAVVGLSEVFGRFLFFRKVFKELAHAARTRRPSAVLLVDYPGFNLRFAGTAHRMGLKVIYYICPQVWAWHRSRMRKMQRTIDRLLVIFPFEVDLFKGLDINVDFVGHPLPGALLHNENDPAPLPWKGYPRLALLPGSREHEVRRLLPVMAGAAALAKKRYPGLAAVIAAPSERTAALNQQLLDETGHGQAWPIITGRTWDVLKSATAALVASGTATIEAALAACPMCVVYKTSPLTYYLGRLAIRIPYIGMVNVLADHELCPELIQGQATPANMAEALFPLLDPSSAEHEEMRQGLRQVASSLHGDDNLDHAARILIKCLNPSSSKK